MNSAQLPTISVVVATYNCADTLERCLHSLETQTFPGAEIIVIDGASIDGTVEILQQHEAHLGHWVSEFDTGIADAWNKGVECCRGDWILFLGGDDYLSSATTLAEANRHLSVTPPSIRVVYGKVDLVSPTGDTLATVGRPWAEVGSEFRRTMAIPHQGVFHHRSLFLDHGAFDTSFVIASDYDFLLRELKRRPPLFLSEVVVTAMQTGGLSSDPSNVYAMSCEFARARFKNGLIGRFGYWYSLQRARLRRTIHELIGPRDAHRLTALLRRLQGRPELPRFER